MDKQCIPQEVDTKEKALTLFLQTGMTVKGFSNALNIGWDKAKRILEYYQITRDRSHAGSRARIKTAFGTEDIPQFIDLKTYPDNPEEFLDAVEDFQSNISKWDIKQSEATVVIPTDKPIAIVMRGDWHWGNVNTLHALLRTHCAIIRDTDGLYSIEDGDLIDGYIKPSMLTGMAEALVAVKPQRHAVWILCKQYLKGKVLATTSGQHDHWSWQEAQFDPIEWVSHDFKVPYLGHGGILHLVVGETEYTIGVRHRGKGSSMYNPVHSILRRWREEGAVDVEVHADQHVAAILHVRYEGLQRVAVRPGSYKPTDDFTQFHGFETSAPIMPVIFFWPNTRRLEAFWDLEKAVEYLQFLRS